MTFKIASDLTNGTPYVSIGSQGNYLRFLFPVATMRLCAFEGGRMVVSADGTGTVLLEDYVNDGLRLQFMPSGAWRLLVKPGRLGLRFVWKAVRFPFTHGEKNGVKWMQIDASQLVDKHMGWEK